MKKFNRFFIIGFMLLLVLLSLTGCIKPYNKPQLETISASQTAFLIPLEGNTKDNQASFDSVEFLESAKVATKRIRISKRWLQTGRQTWIGKWIATDRLVVVERKPESREWTNATTTERQLRTKVLNRKVLRVLDLLLVLELVPKLMKRMQLSSYTGTITNL